LSGNVFLTGVIDSTGSYLNNVESFYLYKIAKMAINTTIGAR